MRLDDISNELIKKFKHKITGKVRFHEVDSFGVVHNLAYFYWIEIAQTEYFENLGFKITPTVFVSEFPLMKVHNEIDYFKPLRLGENFSVLTRVSFIKQSSFEYQNIIFNETDKIIAFAKSILVYLDPKTFEPILLPTRFIELVRNYEGKDVEQLKDFNGPK